MLVFDFFEFIFFKGIDFKKCKPQKSKAEPPILIYVFKRISRLNYTLETKNPMLNYVWLSFWEFHLLFTTLKSSSRVTCGRDGG